MNCTYSELVARQDENRSAFGRMLLSWRLRNGWTQYTVCNWAKEVGFEAISYGNLSVIEQGKAGELRQKAFWQLGEINRRLEEKDWGPVKTQAIKERLEGAKPLGDHACPVWGPVQFWSCYCGLRAVPEAFRATPAPTIGQRKAAQLCFRWRNHMHRVVLQLDLEPSSALASLVDGAAEEHRKRFYAVLTGFGDYRPDELDALWIEGDTYWPEQWLSQWELRKAQAEGQP
jgi:hypothetical protein